MRVLIHDNPLDNPSSLPGWGIHVWPYSWIAHPQKQTPPFVVAFRRRFRIDKKTTIRVHVTADERYELFLDGQRIGRGSERGDQANWFYETYDLRLTPGRHVLVARVWRLGPHAGQAQISVRHGFLLAPEGDCGSLLGTGVAPWEACHLGGYDFARFQPDARFGVPANVAVDATKFRWGFEQGRGGGWVRAASVEKASPASSNPQGMKVHKLTPATLPAMIERRMRPGTVRFAERVASTRTASRPVLEENHDAAMAVAWTGLLKKQRALTVPPGSRVRAVIDLENYYCAFPRLVTTGGAGATVRIGWAESLCVSPEKYLEKHHRDEIRGKCFYGSADTFRLDGGKHRTFDTHWWLAGRFVEVLVETGTEKVVIEEVSFTETRYPLEMGSRFSFSDPKIVSTIPIMVRTLQMCAHETYVDCPFYEQLMYPGDTRPQVLAGYAIASDDRLPRKAIRMFHASLLPSGLTRSQYPCSELQVIPTFSLWWVAMIHDYALWRGDRRFVAETMTGGRRVLDTFLSWRNAEGLVEGDHRWCFVDWIDTWTWGTPHEIEKGGVDAVVNWLVVMVLGLAADVEDFLGEKELARRNRRIAREMSAALVRTFFDPRRGLFADDRRKKYWSEHAQVLAVLSSTLTPARERAIVDAMIRETDLEKTTIFFTHYLFEALYKTRRSAEFFARLGLWKDLPSQGFKTTWEVKGHTRSDCHGWGAHPLYHYYASLLGVRPAGMGFETVTIRPMLGDLSFAQGDLVHPRGRIRVRFERDRGRLSGDVTLPRGLAGTFVHGHTVQRLGPGRHAVGDA